MRIADVATLVEQGKILVVKHPQVGINVLEHIGDGLMCNFTASELIVCRFNGTNPYDGVRMALLSKWREVIANDPSANYEVELLRIVPTINYATFYIHRVLRTTGVAELDEKLVHDGLMEAAKGGAA